MTSRKERPINNPLFTREMIRQCIKDNDLRDGKSILEAFNRGVRKVTKTKTSFRTIDSLFKPLYLVSRDIEEK